MLSLLVPLLAASIHHCSATSLIISIPPSVHLPNPYSLPPSTNAALLSGSPTISPLIAPLNTRSTFEFHNLTIPDSALGGQSYLLTISAPSHVFVPYRVDLIPGGASADGSNAVIEGIWETYPGSAWSDRGPILGGKAAQGGGASGSRVSASLKEQEQEQEQEEKQEQEVRIEAKVIGRREFYEQRPGFNPLSLLMNPMVLLGVVAMAITFGMPYLMDNMDPELRAEFEEQKKNSPLSGMHNALQAAASGASGGGAGGGGGGGGVASSFDLASWMAGAQKSHQGQSSGTDVKEGATRRRRE